MAEISKITLPSGSTYDIKDAQARSDIASIQRAISGGVTFVGTATTALTDGATTNPITIGGESYTATNGDLVVYGSKEFVFDGSKWLEFGDLGSLGALAFKDNASATYTPAGSVSQPTFTGTATTSTGKFTPAGSVSVSTNQTTNKTTTVTTTTGTATYTPAGSVTQPTFSGTAGSVTVTGTPSGQVAITTGSGTANYTPAGTVSKPNVTVTPSTTTVNSITAVGTLPSLTTTVANENLTIGWSAGTLPTKGDNTSVMTGATAALASTPTFSGTGVELTASFSGTATTSTGSFTPAGTVSQPTFNGTGVRLVTGNIPVPSSYTASFTGTEGNVSVSGTPTGNVSKPTFSGTQATIQVS